MTGRSRRPELPLSGGCICEAVRYEVSTMPLLVFACHCTGQHPFGARRPIRTAPECQRWTGSAFELTTAAMKSKSGVNWLTLLD